MALDTIATARLEIAKIYIAAFNRVPDEGGLQNWMNQYTAGLMTYAQIATDFTKQAEYTAAYPSYLTSSEYITEIYQNVFGRNPDEGGLQNWINQIDNSSITGIDRSNVMYSMLQSASATGNTDGVRLTNQATFAVQSVLDDIPTATATAQLANITSDAATVTTATAAVNAAVTATETAGQAFTLTTSVDTLTGTSGNDTFTADNTGTAEASSVADTVNGGNGTDTLKIYSDGSMAGLPALTSIETVVIYDEDANLSIATTPFASVTTANFERNDGEAVYTVGAAVTTVGLADMVATDTVNGTEVIDVTLAAAATTLTLNLNKITAAGTDTDEDVSVIGAGLTTITVNTTGTASSFDNLDVAAASTININAAVALTTVLATTSTTGALTITGAGAVDLGALDDGINTITATTATGALTAAIGAAVDTVVTLGSGNDVITASTTDAIVTADTLAVNAGSGTGDVLVITETADVDTAADAARYTNFEIIRSADSVNTALLSSVTALQITGGTSETYSGLNATRAANITFQGNNATSTIFQMTDSSGLSDSITINLASTTATTDVDVIGISVDEIETVTFNATTGTNTTGDTAIGFLANSADEVTRVNFTGTSDITFTVAANVLDVVAVTLDASTMTGTADFTLVQTSNLVTGSTVNGTLNADTIALGTTLGSTYNGNAGNDGFTGAFAVLVADGSGDTVVNGGDGTDTLTISDTTTTMTDNHFTGVTGMETLALTNTAGDLSITGLTGEFNQAFANGATITTGTMANGAAVTFTSGLATVGVNLTVDATLNDGKTEAKDYAITTGSAADTVTITGDATWTGEANDGSSIVINTGAGNDTISVTIGTMAAQTTSQLMTITGGAGVDSITKVGVNSTTVESTAIFVMAAGDSTTTAYDTITGFDTATATLMSDTLDFDGTAAVGTLATQTDSGTILTHAITAGVATFDDASTYATALVINSTNLADVVGYLAANTATNGVIAFAYDSDASGSADATMVYHNGTTDSLVLLSATTGADAVIIGVNVAGADDLHVA